MSRKLIIEFIVALLILLFAYTGISKLREYSTFEVQLQQSPWALLSSISHIIVWALPIGELIIVGLLMIPRTRLIGLYLSLFAMIFFTGYIGIMLVSGVDLPCTCGGVISYMPWGWHLVFNTFFLILAFIGIKMEKRTNRSEALSFYPRV